MRRTLEFSFLRGRVASPSVLGSREQREGDRPNGTRSRNRSAPDIAALKKKLCKSTLAFATGSISGFKFVLCPEYMHSSLAAVSPRGHDRLYKLLKPVPFRSIDREVVSNFPGGSKTPNIGTSVLLKLSGAAPVGDIAK
jgi:hypothetical protein